MPLFKRSPKNPEVPPNAPISADAPSTLSYEKSIVTDSSPPTLRTVALSFIPIGAERVLVCPAQGNPVRMERTSAEMLARCGIFTSLEQHAQRIEWEFGRGVYRKEDIARELRTFEEAGLLESDVTIRNRPADGAAIAPSGSAEIVSIGIVTGDRPECAKRAMESYAAQLHRYGRKVELNLYDKTRDEVERQRCRRLAQELKADTHIPLRFTGREEKQAFVQALVDEGIPKAIADFCFFGIPGHNIAHGANQNARLLDMVDQVGLEVDDDTICALGRPPGMESTIDGSTVIASNQVARIELYAGDPTDFWYYADVDSAAAATIPSDLDLITLQESLLGKSLRGCACDVQGAPCSSLRMDRSNDKLLSAFASGSGRVALTLMGIAGNSGMSSTVYNLLAHGDNRDRLTVDGDSYSKFMESRAVIRCTSLPTIADGGHFMTYAVGLDNRLLLPPFLPILRNADGLFGTMVSLLIPDAFIGHLPYTIEHRPPEHRSSSRKTLPNVPAGTDAITLISTIIRAFPINAVRGGETAERTRALGRYLRSFSRMGVEGVADYLHPFYVREKARMYGDLEQLLRTHHGEPKEWAEDVEAVMAALEAALTDRSRFYPRDMGPPTDPKGAFAAMLDLIGRYGELLEYWPDIVQTAKALREKGIRVSV